MKPPSDPASEFPWLASPAGRLHHAALGCLLLLTALLVTLAALRIPLGGNARHLDGAFLAVAACSSLLSLTRRLPTSHVLLAGGIIAIVSTLVLTLNGFTGIPAGAKRLTDAFGIPLFGMVQWPLPFLWIALLLSSRGIARLILRPYRKTTYYGFWVIGVSVALVTAFQLSFEPYAVQIRRFWVWETRPNAITWVGVPLTVFSGATLLATLALALATPWLLNKNPVKQPTDYQGLAVWTLLQLAFGAHLLCAELWIPALASAILIAVPGWLAAKGGSLFSH